MKNYLLLFALTITAPTLVAMERPIIGSIKGVTELKPTTTRTSQFGKEEEITEKTSYSPVVARKRGQLRAYKATPKTICPSTSDKLAEKELGYSSEE